MAAKVNAALLTESLHALERAREWPEGLLDQLRAQLESGSEEDAFHINPVAWATQRGLEPELGVQLFLHATRAGLTQIHWSLRCRGCGEIVDNRGGLAQLEHDFYCAACARSSPTTLDEHVEVSFSVARDIRPLRFFEPETLSNEDYFFEYRFSKTIVIKGLDRPLIDFLRQQQRILIWLEAESEQTFDLDLPDAGWVVGNPRTMITTEGEPTTEVRELSLTYGERAFHPRPKIAPGPVRVTLRNPSDQRVRVFLYFTPIVTYFAYEPHLSGHRLLNDPEFRRCLGTDVVRPGTGIPIKDASLLFTDLRGSTAMYDRIGDSAAFELVSEHFESMAKIITRCGGVVVKTMGDAIMASFNNPSDAVRAAVEIVVSNPFANHRGDTQLLPKVGVHRGPCIVVNQNEMLDFFGQTVNVAARVQGVAEGNELCITDAVWDEVQAEPATAELLGRFGPTMREEAVLKGVADPVGLYRLLLR